MNPWMWLLFIVACTVVAAIIAACIAGVAGSIREARHPQPQAPTLTQCPACGCPLPTPDTPHTTGQEGHTDTTPWGSREEGV